LVKAFSLGGRNNSQISEMTIAEVMRKGIVAAYGQ
jgi:hypothetical protein